MIFFNLKYIVVGCIKQLTVEKYIKDNPCHKKERLSSHRTEIAQIIVLIRYLGGFP